MVKIKCELVVNYRHPEFGYQNELNKKKFQWNWMIMKPLDKRGVHFEVNFSQRVLKMRLIDENQYILTK